MTLRHLRIFVAVCETGSTTAAAEKLYLSQPAVSLAVTELERYYGVRLFDRLAKRLYITEAGREFLQYASHIVGLFDEMEREVRNLDEAGVIRIGTSVTIGNYLLPGYLTAFQHHRPRMRVQAVIENSEVVERYVLENRVDLGLVEGAVHSEYVQSEPFRRDELVAICAVGHPFAGRKDVRLEELLSQPLLMREPGSAGREIFESVVTLHGFSASPAWESVSTQALVRAVRKGLGIAVLPYLLVKDSLDRREIRQFQLEGIVFERTFNMIYHRHKFLSSGLRELMEVCRSGLEEPV